MLTRICTAILGTLAIACSPRSNLSHDGECWVYSDGHVWADACTKGKRGGPDDETAFDVTWCVGADAPCHATSDSLRCAPEHRGDEVACVLAIIAAGCGGCISP